MVLRRTLPALLPLAGCDENRDGNQGPTGCSKDTDCSAPRICEQGKCVNPEQQAALERNVGLAPMLRVGAFTSRSQALPGNAIARGSASQRGRGLPT